MSKEKAKGTLYDPKPKEDLQLPPLIDRGAQNSAGSLPKENGGVEDLRQRLGNLSLTI